MITDADIKKLKTTFVTKVELGRALDQTVERIMSVVATQNELREVRGDIKEMKGLLGNIMNILDGITKRFDRHDMEYAGLVMSDNRQNERLDELAQHTKYRFKT